MPQVKIKQGSKSAVNNNAGVLNAGTLAITTDTNELFVTHNDGTVHQLCNPVIDTDQIDDLAITKPKLSQDTYDWIDGKVDKAGDTMSGDLDMGGNQINNGGFEVVTSLPTTNNFEGRQVTYQGRSYIWNGSAWVTLNAIRLPPIPIISEERNKYVNHNLGRYPDVQVTDSNGNIIGVDIRHIDDNNIYLSWYGSIVGTIIIN